MRLIVHPGGSVGGEVRVPGDKSIAHRWLILAATAEGLSELGGLPHALDVCSTARVLAALSDEPDRSALEGWASKATAHHERDRSTSNKAEPRAGRLVLEAHGRGALHAPSAPLDCGNSGTTMRLVAGVVASVPLESVLVGDESLSGRPMERVAVPLREMGATVETAAGSAPIRVRGGGLRGIRYAPAPPSAQVKGAVLLAGVGAEGETSVKESAATRDHTERALRHLGGPVRIEPGVVTVASFQHPGFAGEVPGDLSSAVFLVAGAALTGGGLLVRNVGLNPSRTHVLEVLRRMGVAATASVERHEHGEPVGSLEVRPVGALSGTAVEAHELPLLIDEVPALALLAAHARGQTRFRGGGELRVKESDRLTGLAEAIRGLGGEAAVEGDDLVVGGGGLRGGAAEARRDHRLAMALAVGALAAAGPVTIEGIEAADVSFPRFVEVLSGLGARVKP